MVFFKEFVASLNNPLALTLLVVLLVTFLYQLYFYLRYMRLGSKVTPSTQKEDNFPAVSVIVCARNEHENLHNYLPCLLSQDYPNYEVIVVDDSSEDDTEILLERLSRQHSNLYHTFVPKGARVLSNKKLALTIGIKAAHHDYILLTDADCRPESRYWIREMMQGFAQPNTEIVLGFSPYFIKKGLLNRIIGFETLFNALQYMGMARAGHPYMGVGRNLAYKRATFFETGGFKGLLNNQAGDDDLFVNRIANKTNTSVVSNPYSLTWSIPKQTWHEWLHQKRRHLSVSPHYRTISKLRLGIEPLTRGLFYAAVLCSLLIGGKELMMLAVALFLMRFIMQSLLINISAHRLGLRKVGLGLVAYDILLPLITLYTMVSQYWQKKPLYW